MTSPVRPFLHALWWAMAAAPLAAPADAATGQAAPGPPATGSVSDFRLPEASPAPATPAPDVQGPVASDVPESLPDAAGQARPATPAARVRPGSAPGSASGSASGPALVLPGPAPASVRPPPPAARVATPPATPLFTPGPGTATPVAPPASDEAPAAKVTAGADDAMAGRSGMSGTVVAVLALAALALAGLVAAFLRYRRRRTTEPLPEPEPEPMPEPKPERSIPVAPASPPEGESPAIAAASGIAFTLAPDRLSLTLVNAVLDWRVDLHNLDHHPLAGVDLAVDMVSAHADLSEADRAGGPAADAERQPLGTLAAGERRSVAGQTRLPFPSMTPIWHGDVALLLPVLRLRITAAGAAPVTRTFLVGQPSPTAPGTLQPVRLDLGPRVYADLAHRAFA